MTAFDAWSANHHHADGEPEEDEPAPQALARRSPCQVCAAGVDRRTPGGTGRAERRRARGPLRGRRRSSLAHGIRSRPMPTRPPLTSTVSAVAPSGGEASRSSSAKRVRCQPLDRGSESRRPDRRPCQPESDVVVQLEASGPAQLLDRPLDLARVALRGAARRSASCRARRPARRRQRPRCPVAAPPGSRPRRRPARHAARRDAPSGQELDRAGAGRGHDRGDGTRPAASRCVGSRGFTRRSTSSDSSSMTVDRVDVGLGGHQLEQRRRQAPPLGRGPPARPRRAAVRADAWHSTAGCA